MPRPRSANGFAVRRGVPLLALAAPLAASCSASDASVTGQVTYKGQPIEGAVVTFHPAGDDIKAQRPSGLTDKEGKFTLSTGSKPGAPAGEYVVTVNWYKAVDPPGGKKMMGTDTQQDAPDQFKGKSFADRSSSKLAAKVGSGTNNLEPFRLD